METRTSTPSQEPDNTMSEEVTLEIETGFSEALERFVWRHEEPSRTVLYQISNSLSVGCVFETKIVMISPRKIRHGPSFTRLV